MSVTGNIIEALESFGLNGGNLIIDIITIILSLYVLFLSFFVVKRLKGRLGSSLLIFSLALLNLNAFLLFLSDLRVIIEISLLGNLIHISIAALLLFYLKGVKQEIIEYDEKIKKERTGVLK